MAPVVESAAVVDPVSETADVKLRRDGQASYLVGSLSFSSTMCASQQGQCLPV